MSIKQQIEQDLKTAMLSGDKVLVTTLRGLKSAILYAEVGSSRREVGLSDDEVTQLLQKEAKKRLESALLYRQGGNQESAEAEKIEAEVIAKYLPAPMSDDELNEIVAKEASARGFESLQQMGQLIGAVKEKTAGAADGATIARLVKEYLEK